MYLLLKVLNVALERLSLVLLLELKGSPDFLIDFFGIVKLSHCLHHLTLSLRPLDLLNVAVTGCLLKLGLSAFAFLNYFRIFVTFREVGVVDDTLLILLLLVLSLLPLFDLPLDTGLLHEAPLSQTQLNTLFFFFTLKLLGLSDGF